ncbi:MAG TPA: hypothetical protein VFU63_05440, partial [Ktedonobacterales bacterium]|nr:hypothetical protein [Ktedonobacterales bacterium]
MDDRDDMAAILSPVVRDTIAYRQCARSMSQTPRSTRRMTRRIGRRTWECGFGPWPEAPRRAFPQAHVAPAPSLKSGQTGYDTIQICCGWLHLCWFRFGLPAQIRLARRQRLI